MHLFLYELGLPAEGVLVAGETPDFIYATAGRRIGIETRTLFDNRPIEDAARRERIVSEAQKRAAGDTRFDRRRLWVTFGNAPLPTVKEGVEELVREVDRLPPTRPVAKISNDRYSLFSAISAFPDDTDTRWRAVPKAESPGELTQPVLQQAVDEKDRKVYQYRRDCTELWLLLVLPLFPAQKPAFGQLRWLAASERWSVRTAFDRVFVFEEDSGAPLHEVATVPLRPPSGSPWERRHVPRRATGASSALSARRGAMRPSAPAARPADGACATPGSAHHLMIDPRLPTPTDDRPRICAAPTGGRLFRPTRPPRLTTQTGGASNNDRRTVNEPSPAGTTESPAATHPFHADLTHHYFSTTTNSAQASINVRRFASRSPRRYARSTAEPTEWARAVSTTAKS